MNRLDSETSPYLRQHRDNPVDWFAWGEDAFEQARSRDVPILLSVGYSACHWCHVMAHESFEDEPTAAVMNELFVNIKVDREERPDIDAIYMDAVQAISGQGGWPMTVFMTPEARPFFGGTYFPRDRFVDLMRRISVAWTDERVSLLQQSDQLTEALGRFSTMQGGAELPAFDVVAAAGDELEATFDVAWGGFGSAPKFPPSMALDVLMRLYHRSGDDETLSMVTTTLDAMASGGIYDHLGGGFARYSVDDRWLVPHFEKMLYDQALLARSYLSGWQLTGNDRWLQVCEETIGYVTSELRHPQGGFFSAEDADSEGVEGKFYVWSLEEITAVLGESAEEAIAWYGVTESGNFEGENILHRPIRADLVRPAPIERARRELLAARAQRTRPGLDDKVLTEWNGLMLGTLAVAAGATGRDDWLAAAVSNGEFLLSSLRRDDGRWLRSWQGGRARHLAYAADYAALVDAFTRLGEATGEARWTDEAVATANAMLDLFWDDAHGGLFTTGSDAEALVARPKDLLDNATPSANSLAANAMYRLWAITGRANLLRRADAIVELVGPLVAEHPTAFGHLMGAIDIRADGPTEIVVVGDEPELVSVAQRSFTPNAVLGWGEPYMSPLWEGRSAGLAYVCQGYACQSPTSDPGVLAAQLAGA